MFLIEIDFSWSKKVKWNFSEKFKVVEILLKMDIFEIKEI